MNNYRILLDWRLSTQEYAGLAYVFKRAVDELRFAQDCDAAPDLDEDTLLLAGYASVMTPARLLIWKRRKLRETQTGQRGKRYAFTADLLLLKVLLRTLVEQRLNVDEQALLSRVHQLITNLVKKPLPALSPVAGKASPDAYVAPLQTPYVPNSHVFTALD